MQGANVFLSKIKRAIEWPINKLYSVDFQEYHTENNAVNKSYTQLRCDAAILAGIKREFCNERTCICGCAPSTWGVWKNDTCIVLMHACELSFCCNAFSRDYYQFSGWRLRLPFCYKVNIIKTSDILAQKRLRVLLMLNALRLFVLSSI